MNLINLICKENSRETSTSASLTMLKFECVHHNKPWKILKEMEIPDHLTYLLQNLYTGQEVTVRTGHGKNWFQIGKDCVLSPCLFNLYEERIMQNTWLDEA